VLAFILVAAGFAALLGICVFAISGLPAFGYIWVTFLAVAGILAWLIVGLFRKPRPTPQGLTPRQLWWRRLLLAGRCLFIGVLTFWLGLNFWLVLCPGGHDPPPKAGTTHIRIVTWNIHCGDDHGPPWTQFDWPGRKAALRTALDHAQPDLLCVQEATPTQVAYLEESLPEHQRIGIGRDGEAGGEHTAIFFREKRFEKLDGSTFWLEEPTDQPRAGNAFSVKRICTWVRLRDRDTGRTIRVYNSHLYLTEAPRLIGVKLIRDHILAGDQSDAVVLTADFNAGPNVPSRQLFSECGLTDSAELASQPIGKPTFQLYGIGLWCIDGILVDKHWRVLRHLVLDVKPHNTFPSDHFALLADLALEE
jgi:endonuclease/exonuclease/phosphatase family metal-dependent hydrolase